MDALEISLLKGAEAGVHFLRSNVMPKTRNRRESGVLHHLWRALGLARSPGLINQLRVMVRDASPKGWVINGGGKCIVKVKIIEGEIVSVESNGLTTSRIEKTVRPGRELLYAIQMLKAQGEEVTVITI